MHEEKTISHSPLPDTMPSIAHLDQTSDNMVSNPRPKVYSLNPLRSKALKLAKSSFDLVLPSDNEAGDWRQEADGLLVVGAQVSQEDLEHSSQVGRLRYISKQGAGVDKIHVPTAKTHGVTVMNTPGVNAQAVAELAFGMMITYVFSSSAYLF